jgi:predicted RNA binding protein YcfA (HicA-like mRNA interferase family)
MKKEGFRHLLTIPMHRRDLARGTLRGILDDAGLSEEEFIALLRGGRA